MNCPTSPCTISNIEPGMYQFAVTPNNDCGRSAGCQNTVTAPVEGTYGSKVKSMIELSYSTAAIRLIISIVIKITSTSR